MKKIILISSCTIIILLLAFGIKINFNKESPEVTQTILMPDGSQGYSDGSIKLSEGSFAYALYDSINHKKINRYNLIEPVEGVIKGIIKFQQNVPKKAEYKLFMLVDYKQTEFTIENKKQSVYSFSLKGEKQIYLEFELPAMDEARELTWIIVSEPNLKKLSIDTDEGWSNMVLANSFYTGTYYLKEEMKEQKKEDYDNGFKDSEKIMDVPCMLTKDMSVMKLMPTCKSGDSVKLVFGDVGDIGSSAIMVAFLDWEQVSIQENGSADKPVQINGDKNHYYDLIMPQVNKPTPYQVFLFYNPFVEKEHGAEAVASMRTIIYE